MIKPIKAKQLQEVLALVADIEAGERADLANPEHRKWLTDKIDRYAAAGAEFYGSFEGKALIGFATILVDTRPSGIFDGWGSCELLQIGVLPQHRKGGHASAMIDFIVAELLKRRVACLYLHTYAQDAVAVAFYLKNGFVPCGTVPHVYGPGMQGMTFLARSLLGERA